MNGRSHSTGFTCDRCSRCCRTHRVPVTGADLKRLARVGKDISTCVEFLSPNEVDMSGEPESFARLKEGRRMLFLRHAPQTGGCLFLDDDGCTVHAARPSACRTYPFDRPEGSESLGSVPGHLCPPQTNMLVTLRRNRTDPQHAGFVANVATRDAELREHALFIEAWNRRQRVRVRLGRPPESRREFLVELQRRSGHHP